MTALDPHITLTVVLAMGVGWAMTYAGVAKHALEWRRRKRVCPSCGRDRCSCVRD